MLERNKHVCRISCRVMYKCIIVNKSTYSKYHMKFPEIREVQKRYSIGSNFFYYGDLLTSQPMMVVLFRTLRMCQFFHLCGNDQNMSSAPIRSPKFVNIVPRNWVLKFHLEQSQVSSRSTSSRVQLTTSSYSINVKDLQGMAMSGNLT